MKGTNERLTGVAQAAASIGANVALAERAGDIEGKYHVVCRGAKDECMVDYAALLSKIGWRERVAESFIFRNTRIGRLAMESVNRLREQAESLTEVKWEDDITNLVVTVGKNFLLDNGMAGSGYTAAFFMGLVSSVSYSSIVAGDTQASHAGWLEAGGANAPAYSGVRKTTAWSAASAGSKALSAGLVFTFTASGTVKGCFLGTVATVDGTTGTLFSAGLFSGGDQPVVSTNTLTVSYSLSL